MSGPRGGCRGAHWKVAGELLINDGDGGNTVEDTFEDNIEDTIGDTIEDTIEDTIADTVEDNDCSPNGGYT